MTHKTSGQTRFHWCKQMPSTLFLCMMPAYCRITSPAEPAATGSQQSQLETWWGHGGRGGASCSSTAENVSPLSWAANHTPACDCIFTAAKVELLCATQWTSGHAMQSTTTTLSITAHQNQFTFSRTDWCCQQKAPAWHSSFLMAVWSNIQEGHSGLFLKIRNKKLSENLPSSGFQKIA